MNFKQPRTTIRLTVVTVFVLATAFTAAIAIGLQYHFGQALGRDAAAELYASTAQSIASETAAIRQINVNVLELLSQNPQIAQPGHDDAPLETFVNVLKNNPLIYGLYVGREDGSFYEVVNLDASERSRGNLLALPSDRWVVVTVETTADGAKRRYEYLDKNLVARTSREEPTGFHVTERPWYTMAIKSDKVEATAPYLFAQSGEPGRTLSRRVNGANAVIGLDMTLRTQSQFLSDRQISADSSLYLYIKDGMVIASNRQSEAGASDIPQPGIPLSRDERTFLLGLGTLTVSNEMDWPPIDYAQGGQPRGYSVDVMHLVARMLGLKIRFVNGYTWPELEQQFREGKIDVLQSASATSASTASALAGRPYAAMPFGVLTLQGPGSVDNLAQLNGTRLAIPAGWSVLPKVRKRYPNIEVVEASSTLDAIEKVKSGEAYAALDSTVILRYVVSHYFVEGVQVHENVDLGIPGADGELFMLVGQDRKELRKLLDRAIAAIGPRQHAALEAKWLTFKGQQYSADQSETVPSSELVAMAQDPDRWNSLATTQIDGRDYLAYAAKSDPGSDTTAFIGILTPVDTVMAPYLEKIKISLMATGGFLLLLLPLSWLFANPIVRPVKQLAAENDKVRRREYDQVQRVGSHIRELDELSESMVRMVASIRDYEAAQRELMDAFIRLIAQAIDDKSPYTGGHCERVPELALMLAQAANDSDDPPFADFGFRNDDEWREYRIAAWLHDCGKITTPEHIVDKGSKLETIYNRIHEVRMRFEVLSRDAEVEYWEALAAHPEQREQLEERLQRRQRELQEDFEFVAECNVGGEYLDEDRQKRLLQIAKTTWQRRFDDRLGLSPVEELNLRGDAPPLPATEHLLADKPEHIIERTRSTNYPPQYGIDMEIPEHLYNQGEIYNLSISRGTLTAEDRFKINEHMISTIKMLESLPFPEGLRKVPRYASTHHETMRGSGYPRKLPGSQLSIPERILAVADVFEALTASDRPYKKAKPVSVAIDILHSMVEENHIDRDCFELFLRSGVYREYADRYLNKNQADDVDLDKYLA